MSSQVTASMTHPVVGAVTAAFDGLGGVRDAAVFGLADDELEAAIAGCEGVRARVVDTELALVAEADGRDLGRRLGAASTAAWLRERFRLRPGDARRLVELANRTRADDGPVDYAANVRGRLTGRELRETGQALAEGVISPEHLAVVGRVMRELPTDVPVDKAQEVEADLAGFCRQFDPLTVARLGQCIVHMLADETLDDREDERHRKRELWIDETTGRISGQLTAEGLALLRTALDPLAAPAPAADGEHDPRSAGQRLADALVELARRAIAADTFEANHGISHRVMVLIGLDTLTGDHHHEQADTPDSDNTPHGAGDTDDINGPTDDISGPTDDVSTGDNTGRSDTGGSRTGNNGTDDNGTGSSETGDSETGTSVTGSNTGRGDDATLAGGRTVGGDGAALPGFTRRQPTPPGQIQWGGFISPAAAKRIACCAGIQRVLLDPAGAVLDVGRDYRTATPAQFAALTARDGGCAFPGCTRPPSWCIAHHIIHWADGGPTNLDNLVLLCTWHHTVVHHHGWSIAIRDDRLPEFIPPRWVDPDQHPRRNTRPRHRQTTIPPDR